MSTLDLSLKGSGASAAQVPSPTSSPGVSSFADSSSALALGDGTRGALQQSVMSKTTIGSTGDGSLVVSQVSTKTSVQETPTGVAIKVTEVASVTVIQGAQTPQGVPALPTGGGFVDRNPSAPASEAPHLSHSHHGHVVSGRGDLSSAAPHSVAASAEGSSRHVVVPGAAESIDRSGHHGAEPVLRQHPSAEVREGRADSQLPVIDRVRGATEGRLPEGGSLSTVVDRALPSLGGFKEVPGPTLAERVEAKNTTPVLLDKGEPKSTPEPSLALADKSDLRGAVTPSAPTLPSMSRGLPALDSIPSLIGREQAVQPGEPKTFREPGASLNAVIASMLNEDRSSLGRSLQQGISQEFGNPQAASSVLRSPLSEVVTAVSIARNDPSVGIAEVRTSIMMRLEQLREAIQPRDSTLGGAEITRGPANVPREVMGTEVPLPSVITTREPGGSRSPSPVVASKEEPIVPNEAKGKVDALLGALSSLSEKIFNVETLRQIDRALETTCISIAALAVLGVIGGEKALEKMVALGAEVLRRIREIAGPLPLTGEELGTFEDLVTKLEKELHDRGVEQVSRGGELVADIVGIVVCAETGQRLSDVSVDGGDLGLTRTDVDGQFRFNNIALHTLYRIVLEDPRYSFNPDYAIGSVGELNLLKFQALFKHLPSRG